MLSVLIFAIKMYFSQRLSFGTTEKSVLVIYWAKTVKIVPTALECIELNPELIRRCKIEVLRIIPKIHMRKNLRADNLWLGDRNVSLELMLNDTADPRSYVNIFKISKFWINGCLETM